LIRFFAAVIAAPDFRNTDHRRLGDSDERIQEYRKAGRTYSRHDITQLAGQIKVSEVKVGNCALEYNDAELMACVHTHKQILKALEHRAIHNVEGRVVEDYPPVRRLLLDDPQWRS
jgi:hypothetical protein